MGNVVLTQSDSIVLCPVHLFLGAWRRATPANRQGSATHNRYSDNNLKAKEKMIIIPS